MLAYRGAVMCWYALVFCEPRQLAFRPGASRGFSFSLTLSKRVVPTASPAYTSLVAERAPPTGLTFAFFGLHLLST